MAVRKLRLIHPAQYPGKQKNPPVVAVAFDLAAGVLQAKFEVTGQAPYANEAYPRNASQWGLWDFDVVEVFVRASAREKTYYEFQVSPLGQYFELEIFEPRKKTNREFQSGFTHSATVTGEKSWCAEMKIPLERLGWDGKASSLCGGAFAILGDARAKTRTYWSLFLEPQEKPDFHLPELFRPLID